MDDTLKNMNVPIIQAHKDQRLVIDFVRNDKGENMISFTFEPDMDVAVTFSQKAAVNVANNIIEQFSLNVKGEENDKPSRIIH